MYMGQHFTTFTGSVHAHNDAARWVRTHHGTPLPPPTPMNEVVKRWKGGLWTPAPTTAASGRQYTAGSQRVGTGRLPGVSSARRSTARVSTRDGTGQTTRTSLTETQEQLREARATLDSLTQLKEARDTIRSLREDMGLSPPPFATPPPPWGGDRENAPRTAQLGEVTETRYLSPEQPQPPAQPKYAESHGERYLRGGTRKARTRPMPPIQVGGGGGAAAAETVYYRDSSHRTMSQKGRTLGGTKDVRSGGSSPRAFRV